MIGKIKVYLPDTDIETDVLRQGDLISKIHVLGAINLNAISYIATDSNPNEKNGWMMQSRPVYGDSMVLSHSCEIAAENGIKLTSIILAPVRDIHTATERDRIQALIESNIIDPNDPKPSFLKYFYIPPNPKLEHNEGAIVDFSKCFSVRKQSYPLLVGHKVGQLTEGARNSMALKLAMYFYRQNNPQAA